jgi:pimeloyl-ACP methyl ester carboxylesterase
MLDAGPLIRPLAVGLALALASAGLAHAEAPAACPDGVYRSPAGDLVAITPAPPAPAAPGRRYTRLDGEAGKLDDPTAPIVCRDGVITDRGGAEWRVVELRATPSDFTAKDGTKLHGVLVEPVKPPRKPALVVLVHGSEKSSPIGRYHQLLMAAQGVSAFAYDKRGTGGSGGVYTQDFGVLSDDAAAAVAEARKLAADRFSRIGLWGGSQGGWVAPAAALKSHADFVEVAFGMVATPVEQDQWQVDVQLRERGFAVSILPEVHEVTAATADVARSNFTAHFDELDQMKAKYGDQPWFSKIDGQYSGELLQGKIDQAREESPQVPWDYDSEAVLRQLKVPQLWAMAEDDSVAPSAHSIERLEALKRSGPPIEIVVFPHTDHGIRLYTVDAEGQHHTTRMADGYLRLLADWAKRTPQPPYGDSFKP